MTIQFQYKDHATQCISDVFGIFEARFLIVFDYINWKRNKENGELRSIAN